MERNLTRFIRALRSAGADISTAEAIDAAQVLALVGYRDRETMKTSLGVALAKSEEEKILVRPGRPTIRSTRPSFVPGQAFSSRRAPFPARLIWSTTRL